MEEILSQILTEIKGLKSGQQRLEDGQSQLWQEVSKVNQNVSTLNQEVSIIKQEVSTIKQEMGTKTQQRENTEIVKAILHNQEIANAKLEALALNTATREYVERLEAKFDNLNVRLFNQEAEVTRLKAVK